MLNLQKGRPDILSNFYSLVPTGFSYKQMQQYVEMAVLHLDILTQ